MFLVFLALMARSLLATVLLMFATRDCRSWMFSKWEAIASGKSRSDKPLEFVHCMSFYDVAFLGTPLMAMKTGMETEYSPGGPQLTPQAGHCTHPQFSHIFSSRRCSTAMISFVWMPYARTIFHSDGLYMLSKALVKSIKPMTSGTWHSAFFIDAS